MEYAPQTAVVVVVGIAVRRDFFFSEQSRKQLKWEGYVFKYNKLSPRLAVLIKLTAEDWFLDSLAHRD